MTRLAPLLILLGLSLFLGDEMRVSSKRQRGERPPVAATARERASRAPVFCACGSRAIGLLGKCTEIWAMNGCLKWLNRLVRSDTSMTSTKCGKPCPPCPQIQGTFLSKPAVGAPSTIQCGCYTSILPGIEDWHTEWGIEGVGSFEGFGIHLASSWTITFSNGEIVHLLHNFIFGGRFRNERQR